MILIRTVVITFFNSILILNYLLVNFYSKIIALINYRKVYSILEQQCYSGISLAINYNLWFKTVRGLIIIYNIEKDLLLLH